MENPVFHKRKRGTLVGKDFDEVAKNNEKSFEQYLLDAFEGEVVQKGNQFFGNVSSLTKDNLIRLNQF